MKCSKLRVAASIACALIAIPAFADKNSPSAEFDVFQWNKKIASTTYSIDSSKNGLKVRSSVLYTTASQGSTTSSYKFGSDGVLDDAAIRNATTKVVTIYTPGKNNEELSIDILKDGKPAGGQKIPLKVPGDIVIVFPEDPSVFEVAVHQWAEHPHSDGIYLLLVPPQATKPGRFEPYMLKDKAEAKGKLNGQELVLNDYVLRFNGGLGHVYTDKDGNLMHADIKPLNVQSTRHGFELVP